MVARVAATAVAAATVEATAALGAEAAAGGKPLLGRRPPRRNLSTMNDSHPSLSLLAFVFVSDTCPFLMPAPMQRLVPQALISSTPSTYQYSLSGPRSDP